MTTTLAQACAQWHTMYGRYTTCDLDCGAGEIVMETFQHDAEAREELFATTGHLGIRCACCKGRHMTIAVVKFCFEVKRDSETFERNEAAMLEALAEAGECEHGLSAALCSGPSHYGTDF